MMISAVRTAGRLVGGRDRIARLCPTSAIARHTSGPRNLTAPPSFFSRVGLLRSRALPLALRLFSAGPSSNGPQTVTFSFVLRDGTEREVSGAVGDTLLDVARDNNIDEVEGACDGSCACSTCHMIFPQDVFDKLEPACDEEEDMLDMALHLTATSRLGCQIDVSELLAGCKVQLPEETVNLESEPQ